MRKAAAAESVSPKRASIGQESVGTTTVGTGVRVGVGVGIPGPNGRAPNPVADKSREPRVAIEDGRDAGRLRAGAEATWACAALLSPSSVNPRQAARAHDAKERLIKGFRILQKVPRTMLPVPTLPQPGEP